jgi:hypothetical protein
MAWRGVLTRCLPAAYRGLTVCAMRERSTNGMGVLEDFRFGIWALRVFVDGAGNREGTGDARSWEICKHARE